VTALQFYWHIHHDKLVECATEPIEERIEYIRKYKLPDEIETRLRLLKPVRGSLPAPFVEAMRAYDEAWRAYVEARHALNEAWRAYEEAGRAYDEARRAHAAEIEALHAAECPNCPWDGETIFPKETP
jgi:hypothetical protein